MVRESVEEQGVCLQKAGQRMLLHSGSSCWPLAASGLGLSPATTAVHRGARQAHHVAQQGRHHAAVQGQRALVAHHLLQAAIMKEKEGAREGDDAGAGGPGKQGRPRQAACVLKGQCCAQAGLCAAAAEPNASCSASNAWHRPCCTLLESEAAHQSLELRYTSEGGSILASAVPSPITCKGGTGQHSTTA